MKADGYDQAFPIVAWNGVVVDGHTRLRSARAAGLDRVPVVYRQFESESEALEYAIACQRNRRNLTDAELVRCVAELGKRQRGGAAGTNPQDCGLLTPPSAAQVAETLGVSTRKVEQIHTIADHATPEIKTALDSGDLSVNAAYKATQEARKEPTAPVRPPEPGALLTEAETAILERESVAVRLAVAEYMLEHPHVSACQALAQVRRKFPESVDEIEDEPGFLGCPFCGNDTTLMQVCGPYLVECEKCAARGPRAATYHSALEGWNRRA
jgi:ParB family chromosome partitioning protein